MPGEASRRNGKKGGRPKGSKNAATIEREAVSAEFRQRVFRAANVLFDAQMTLARGCSFLYKRQRTKNGQGVSDKAELVTNEQEIQAYLNGDEPADAYYYITTDEPSNNAIRDMLDRALGKPKEQVEVTGADGAPVAFTLNLNARDRDV